MKFLFSLAFLFALLLSANAAVHLPTQDTYANLISQGGQCAFRGNEPAIWSGRSGFGSTLSTGYLLFPLTESSVNHAYVLLTAGCAPQSDVDGIFGNGHTLYRTAIGWTESTLSGTTLPGLTQCPSLPSVINMAGSGTVDSNGFLNVTVTSSVAAALSSGAISFSNVFTDAGNNRGTNFCTRTASGADDGKEPMLFVS